MKRWENDFFDIDLVQETVDYVHKQGKKVYYFSGVEDHLKQGINQKKLEAADLIVIGNFLN